MADQPKQGITDAHFSARSLLGRGRNKTKQTWQAVWEPQAQAVLASIVAVPRADDANDTASAVSKKVGNQQPEQQAHTEDNNGSTTTTVTTSTAPRAPSSSSNNISSNKTNKTALLALPEIVIACISDHLASNRDRKQLRLACRDLSCAVRLRIPRAYLSTNPRNVEVLLGLANNPFYASRVTELVWDDARLVGNARDAEEVLLGRTATGKRFGGYLRTREEAKQEEQQHEQEEEEEERCRRRRAGSNADEQHQGSASTSSSSSSSAAAPQESSRPTWPSCAPAWFRVARVGNKLQRLLLEKKAEINALGGAEAYWAHRRSEQQEQQQQQQQQQGRQQRRRRQHEDEDMPDWAEQQHQQVEQDPTLRPFTHDKHNTQRDWEYYTMLLDAQYEIEQTGAHFAAFAVALEKFTNLKTVTISYTAHGRAGAGTAGRYETPMIRAFPEGFNYLVPLGWEVDRAAEEHEQLARDAEEKGELPEPRASPPHSGVPRPAGTDALTAVLRILASPFRTTSGNRPTELRVDDGGLGLGVHFDSLRPRIDLNGHVVRDEDYYDQTGSSTHYRAHYRSRLDMLAHVVAQPGFDKLCLHLRWFTADHQGTYIESGFLGEVLARANGGRGLRSLELSLTPDHSELPLRAGPAHTIGPSRGPPMISLPKLLTTDNAASLEHLALSHMTVDEHELLATLSLLPRTTKTIKLFNVALRRPLPGHLPHHSSIPWDYTDTDGRGWRETLQRIRDQLAAAWATFPTRPVLSIGTRAEGFVELMMGARRVWVTDEVTAYLYHDHDHNHDQEHDHDHNHDQIGAIATNPLGQPWSMVQRNRLEMGLWRQRQHVDELPIIAPGDGYTDDALGVEGCRERHEELPIEVLLDAQGSVNGARIHGVGVTTW
ncbi:uncharacterized protein B0I36DRAFT_369351 [Microdochium trichocladiopsis]|uniref:F-box domain-containing protein n=1 Tax=Microdochium trichocladiopsis TaxID=1682393 RepID=A0A9P8XTP2_9PEZI|nr:uncharacterized protein B0I36DRAFT_369351 [Microdochium trichocladiopsis]KAH7014391.1 hypothetical protein B0I36DRAFT_369351 [Microdochium trichocladiopsis]